MSILNSIQNGIIGLGGAIDRAIGTDALPADTRAPDRSRPRINSQDPTAKIDKKNNLSVLQYPHDRPKYYMSFGVMEYSRPSQFKGLETTGITDYICLPLPSNLNDNTSMNYSQESSDFIVEAATPGAQSFAKTGSVGDFLMTAGGSLTGAGVQGVRTAGSIAIGDKMTGGLLQLAGLADNPLMTVMFKGPNFKQHNFTWRFSARNAKEADQVNLIVNTFKKISHPELLTVTHGGFYKMPNIILPKFNPDKIRNRMYNFKPCVITDVGINWAPNLPSFHADGNPNEMIMTIQLLEIELWRNGDSDHASWSDTNSWLTLETIGNGDFNNIPSPPVRNLGAV